MPHSALTRTSWQDGQPLGEKVASPGGDDSNLRIEKKLDKYLYNEYKDANR
jgi:hypothetical protein